MNSKNEYTSNRQKCENKNINSFGGQNVRESGHYYKEMSNNVNKQEKRLSLPGQ